RFFTNLIIRIAYRLFDFDSDPDNSAIGKHIRNYMVFLGAFLILQIWIKDLKTLAYAKTIFKIISIIFATNIIVDSISPTGLLIRLSQKRKGKKLVGSETNAIMNNFLYKIVRVVLYIIALALISKELGYNINGMVAGLGIGSALLALAIQDTVKSFVSGASILAEKPFVIGDFIVIKDGSEEVMGTVEDITLRNTKIRLLNNSLGYIPNLKLTNSSVLNYSKIENRRIDFTLQFPMEITTEKLYRIMSKIKIYLESVDKIINRTITVALITINVYSKDIRVYFYIDESKYKRYLEIQEAVNFKIMEIIDSENVSLAKPTQILEFKESNINNINSKSVDLKEQEENDNGR
ncbi:MAG: mechanosensitive ion channel family protein, partial [Tissierellia bacterium]|nr:mechanosensitive ion channel family protein [Tissierellia bacterium]